MLGVCPPLMLTATGCAFMLPLAMARVACRGAGGARFTGRAHPLFRRRYCGGIRLIFGFARFHTSSMLLFQQRVLCDSFGGHGGEHTMGRLPHTLL
jgi:hypothetical protein